MENGDLTQTEISSGKKRCLFNSNLNDIIEALIFNWCVTGG